VIQQQIVTLLRGLGAFVYVLGTRRASGDYQGTRQTPGIPDLYAFIPHRQTATIIPLWVECKAYGARPTPQQVEFAARCGLASAAHVIGGLDDVIAWLLERGVLTPDRVAHYRLPGQPAAPAAERVNLLRARWQLVER